MEAEEFEKAAALAREARAILPKDPTLQKLWMKATGEASIESNPPGADVAIRPYKGDESTWESLGVTPIKKVRVPNGDFVWRVARAGYHSAYFIDRPPAEWGVKLPAEGSVPPGMVTVPGRRGLPRMAL